MGLTIAELASNFIPFNRKIGKKYSPSLPGKHRIIRKNPRMTNANLGSEILGAITLKNVITPATNFPEFAFSSISFSPRIIFRESRAILKTKKREEEDKERLQQPQFARVNPKWFLIPFPRNERTRLFPLPRLFFSSPPSLVPLSSSP